VTVAVLASSFAAFLLVLRAMAVERVAGDALRTARSAVDVMAAPHLTDEEKEARVRRASLHLFNRFLVLVAIGAVALAAATAIIWAGASAGLYEVEEAVHLATAWWFIVATCIASVVLWLGLNRLQASVRA
jgi:hypothetical protein